MIRILMTALLLLSATNVIAKKSTKPKTKEKSLFEKRLEKLEWNAKFKIGGDHVNNTQVQARVFGVTGSLDLEYPITDTLEFEMDFGANLEVGSNNSFIIDEYAPRRQWRLGHAYLEWEPMDWFELSVGAINQKRYYAPLLVTRTAFLAAEMEASFDITDNHTVFFVFEHAIPNNLNLAQRIGIVEDGTPLFTMATVGVDFRGDLLTIKWQGMKWEYSNLSTGVAYQSQFIGNSISGGGQLNSDFIYGFNGYTTSGEVLLMLSDDFGFRTTGQFIYNEKAPDGRNVGHLATASIIINGWEPYVGTFKVESDASVAFYNNGRTGHNNTEGNVIGLAYKAADEQTSEPKGRIEYVNYDPLEASAFQSNTKAISFSITMPFK